jgi:ankyrin repeat protein
LFVLAWNDYQQLSSTYVDDAAKVVEQVISMCDNSGHADKSQASLSSAISDSAEGASKVKYTIEAALKRQNNQITINLLEIVADGDIDKVDAVLSCGKVSVDDVDNAGRTALHIACSRGHLDVVKLLLSQYNATHSVRCARIQKAS